MSRSIHDVPDRAMAALARPGCCSPVVGRGRLPECGCCSPPLLAPATSVLLCPSPGRASRRIDEVIVAAPASFASEVRAAGFEQPPVRRRSARAAGAVFGRLPSLSVEEANAIVIADVFGRLAAQAALPDLVAMVDERRPDIVVSRASRVRVPRRSPFGRSPPGRGGDRHDRDDRHLRLAVAAPLAELDALAGLPEGAAAAALRGSSTLTCVPAVLDRSGRTGSTGTGSIHRYLDELARYANRRPSTGMGRPVSAARLASASGRSPPGAR